MQRKVYSIAGTPPAAPSFPPAGKDGGEKGRWVPLGAGFRALKNLPRSNPFRPSCSREGRSRASASQKKAGAGRVAGPYRLIILRPDQPFVLAAALLMDLTYLAFRYAQTSLYQISYHAPSSVSSETPVTATTVSVGMVMKTSTFPFPKELKGETLITTDGTTLLGADDKSGVAEILTAAETIIQKKLPHGKLCIAFTPDEEIGEGASLFDIPGFGADFAYTVDGGDVGGIEYENFNAAAATVTIHGFSVHPGSAKDAMINASNVAMEFHTALPIMARPETTEGRQGFYHLCQMYGDVTNAKLGYILRDHDADKLQYKKDNLLHIADYLNGKYGPGTVEVEIKDSYRNMLEKIKPHFHLVENARKAIEKAGLTPEEVPVRGGTDGATLSWKGLPCPNLGTGGFNFHGVCECTTVERMDKATEILLNIVEIYSK